MTHALCCNCGVISPQNEWAFLQRTDGGFLRPSYPHEGDPIMMCPVCGWLHQDNESSLGVYEGTDAEMIAERLRLLQDPMWADSWLWPWEGQDHA